MRVRFTVVATLLLPAVAAMSGLVLASHGSLAAAKPKPTCIPGGQCLITRATSSAARSGAARPASSAAGHSPGLARTRSDAGTSRA